MHNESVKYLHNIGVDFKPAESPDLWSFLEEEVTHSFRLGHKFAQMSPAIVNDIIHRGERALLEAMVTQHLLNGKIDHVTQVIEMPFLVGRNSVVAISETDRANVLNLVDMPGTAREHVIHVIPEAAERIPTTYRVTVKGGLYADGHTAGYFDLCPGELPEEGGANGVAFLATPQEILALAHEMAENIDDIVVVSRKASNAMIAQVTKVLGC